MGQQQEHDNFNPFVGSLHSDKEHVKMLMDLKQVLDTTHGRDFIKYLFKHFMVGSMPPAGLDPNLRDDLIGFMRAGSSIFQIAAQADNTITGIILATAQKEKTNVT